MVDRQPKFCFKINFKSVLPSFKQKLRELQSCTPNISNVFFESIRVFLNLPHSCFWQRKRCEKKKLKRKSKPNPIYFSVRTHKVARKCDSYNHIPGCHTVFNFSLILLEGHLLRVSHKIIGVHK